jgi:cytochrome P450 family 710 subfamily A protein
MTTTSSPPPSQLPELLQQHLARLAASLDAAAGGQLAPLVASAPAHAARLSAFLRTPLGALCGFVALVAFLAVWEQLRYLFSRVRVRFGGEDDGGVGVAANGNGAAANGKDATTTKQRSWLSLSLLPGPTFVPPFLGGIVAMVRDPHAFWERQRAWSRQPGAHGLSWNSIVTKFTVMVTDPQLIRHVFNHNSADSLLLDLHPNAKMILGTRNIAFMHGPPHKALRRSFLALFTRKALGVYVRKQDAVIREHLTEWMAAAAKEEDNGGKNNSNGSGSNNSRAERAAAAASVPAGSFTPLREVRDLVRDMNAYTSQEVFAGPYLDDPEERDRFSDAYRAMTEGFLALPLKLPGTKVWRAMQGRQYVIKVLTRASARSKARMAAGAEPDCLLDFWTQQLLQECKQAEADGVAPPPYASDGEVAYTVMDFLFASQDASTASLVWTLALMADHPEVLARVREEQEAVRGGDRLKETLTAERLAAMPFTRQVVREILRYRPPAPMVPQVAMRPFRLGPDYVAPKGAFIVPHIFSACLAFPDGEKFDPDRFGPERREDVEFAGNYLVFGHGPHYCVGKEYAINHLVAFLALASTSLDWERKRTQDSDNILYLPTLYPGDAFIRFAWRDEKQARVCSGVAA